MERFSQCWFVTNPASGSNREAEVARVKDLLVDSGIAVSRESAFPDDALPTRAELDELNIELVVIFTGDGTANAAISQLEGWGGAILFLPGGTKNLLAKRLHREFDTAQIIELVAAGAARKLRPQVCRSRHGWALAGLLVGPGTCWSNVREATRNMDLPSVASGVVEAISETASGPPVHAEEPALGRGEGYQLIEITPGEFGLQLDGFYADTAGDYARQGWAVLRRAFREGPHDRVGIVERVIMRSEDGSPINMLLDGEPVDGGPTEEFTAEPSPVFLLATAHSD